MDDVGGFEIRDAADGPPEDAAPEVRAAAVDWPKGYSMTPGGLYYQPPPAADGAEKSPVWLCRPFTVEGEARDSNGDGWGLLLSWKDRDGRPHSWVLPKRALLGDADAVEGVLMNGGLDLSTASANRQRLRDALTKIRTPARVTLIDRTGWHATPAGSAYVSADGSSHGDMPERMVLRTAAPDAAGQVARSGTLEQWRDNVGALAVGNDLAALFVSAAFAGPLLDLLGEPSGGVHAFGKSQKGKTTILRMAASVWGPPEAGKAMRNWRSTSNALEAIAAAANDALLALDEIGQCDGREVAEISYMIANESGKSRAARDGSARAVRSWRVILLSTGEMDMATKVAEAGKRVMAGQVVRLLSVPLPDGGPLGQHLHGKPDAYALLVAANEAAKRFHGTAAPEFLGLLALERAANAEGLSAQIDAHRAGWVKAHLPAGADGQVRAAARRFGIIAAAGELAAAWAVLPWPEGEASRAAGACFKLWVRHRGGAGAHEDADALDAVRRFISLHGPSRFTPIGRDDGDKAEQDQTAEISPDRPTIQRAGWRQKVDGIWDFYVLPAVFRGEICAGRDPKAVAAALEAAKLLRTEGKSHPTVKLRIAGYGRPRVYAVRGAIVGGGEIGE